MGGRQALFFYAWALVWLISAQDAAAQSVPAQGRAHAAVERAPDRFLIAAYDVAGVTKLSAPDVERLVYPFVGPDRTSVDVESARKALQDAYAAKGFEAVVVDVGVQPQETFSQGTVEITVSEAPVGLVRVTSSKYHALSVVRAQVPSLVEGQPVDFKALQSDIAAANRFPDRSINPDFKVGKVPGTVDVDLKVSDDRPLHASLELNNDNSPSTVPLRLTASARYTNLWQGGQTATFTYVVAPQRRSDTEVFAGSYTIPFIGTPWTVSVSGYKSNSNIAALGGSNVLGNGYQVGIRAIYRLPSDRTVQTLSFGPDFKDFKQNILVAGVQASTAPVRYIPIEAQYALAGATERTSYGVTLGVTAGIRAIKKFVCDSSQTADCIPVDQFRNREQFSNENFVHGNISLDYSIAFKNDIVGAFRLSGQIADSHLITNEQFAAGGLLNVRGYYQSEAVGDTGVTGGIEFRSPSFASHFGKFVTEARVYAFVDGGYVHISDALPEQTVNYRLVSVGGGARVRLFDLLSGELLVGLPLSDGAVTKARDPRITFVAKGEF